MEEEEFTIEELHLLNLAVASLRSENLLAAQQYPLLTEAFTKDDLPLNHLQGKIARKIIKSTIN